MPDKKLLFIDTNIWLDFYRSRSDVALKLLEHVEAISDQLVITYQLESEFKKNRQSAILDGLKELTPPQKISRLGIFSDAKASATLAKGLSDADKSVKALRRRLLNALKNPSTHDPVYQSCQRIFRGHSDLVLKRENKLRDQVRRKAFKRFLHGCPPRKSSDTSIGDAFNWEWMIRCAVKKKANLVVVSRDLDYGVTLDGVSYANDHLRQEFSERVSKKKKLLLYARLTDALKLFEITISQQEEEADDVAQRSHEEFTTFKLDSSFNSTDARNLRLQKLFAAIRRVEPADATPSPAE
jgi:predicted nucleic acid-binding protein